MAKVGSYANTITLKFNVLHAVLRLIQVRRVPGPEKGSILGKINSD